jgi:putative prophage lambdaCh01, repressor protein|nr:MAG TPA: Repressor protein CI [Caudoviricetes sp.]
MKIGLYVKHYRERHKLSMQEFADKADLSKGYISMLEKGKHPQNDREIVPSIETVNKIAKAMNLSIDELLARIDGNQMIDISRDRPLPSNIITPAAYAVPILGTICAGNGIHCEENFQGHFYVDRTIKADYCLKVKGDSMIDAGIYDGDFAFIRRSFDYSDGDIYAVCWGVEESASLKKLYKMDDKVMLQPCNSDYAPTLVDVDDIYIVGECIGTYHAR